MTPLPPARRSPDEQARLDAALVDLFQHRIRFNQVLGLKIDSVRPGDVRATLPMRDELIGHYSHGRLHGGVISATLDALGGLALMVAIGERHPAETATQVLQRFSKMGTIDLRTDYLRPGLASSYTVTAEVLRLGGRVGSTQMRLHDTEGRLIATGAGAYIVS
jgi:uncharacterized protein (TIGR00369 family)